MGNGSVERCVSWSRDGRWRVGARWARSPWPDFGRCSPLPRKSWTYFVSIRGLWGGSARSFLAGRPGGASRNDRDAWWDLGHGSLSAVQVRSTELDQRPDVVVHHVRSCHPTTTGRTGRRRARLGVGLGAWPRRQSRDEGPDGNRSPDRPCIRSKWSRRMIERYCSKTGLALFPIARR
jgi:hypothetical protein